MCWNVIKSRYQLSKGFLLCGSISSTVVNIFIKSSTIPFSHRKVPHLRFTRIVPQAQEKYFSLLHHWWFLFGEHNFLDFSWRVTLRGPGSRYRLWRRQLVILVVVCVPSLEPGSSSQFLLSPVCTEGSPELGMKTLQNDDLLWQRSKAVTCNNQTQSKHPDCKLG